MYNTKNKFRHIKEDNENNRIIRDLKGHNWLLRKLKKQIKLQLKIDKARLSNTMVEIRSKRRKYTLPVSIPLSRLGILTIENRKINMAEDNHESEDAKQEFDKLKINPVFQIPTTTIIRRTPRPEETIHTNQQKSPVDYTRALSIDIPPSFPPVCPNQPRSHIPSHDLQPLLRHSKAAKLVTDGNHDTLISPDTMNDQIDINGNHRVYIRKRRALPRFNVDATTSPSKSNEAAQQNKICQTDFMFAQNSDDTNLITFLQAHGLNKDRMMSLLAIENNNNNYNYTIENIDVINNDDNVMNQIPKRETGECDYCPTKEMNDERDEREFRNSPENLESSIPNFMAKVLSHLSKIEHVLCDLRDQNIKRKLSPKKTVNTQTAENTESIVVVHSSKRQRVPPNTNTASIKREAHPPNSSNDNMLSLPLRCYNTPPVSHRDPRMGSMHLMQGGYQPYGHNSRMDTFYNAASGSTGAGMLEMTPGNQFYNMAVNSSPTQQYMNWLMSQKVGTEQQSNAQKLREVRPQWEAHQNMPPRR